MLIKLEIETQKESDLINIQKLAYDFVDNVNNEYGIINKKLYVNEDNFSCNHNFYEVVRLEIHDSIKFVEQMIIDFKKDYLNSSRKVLLMDYMGVHSYLDDCRCKVEYLNNTPILSKDEYSFLVEQLLKIDKDFEVWVRTNDLEKKV